MLAKNFLRKKIYFFNKQKQNFRHKITIFDTKKNFVKNISCCEESKFFVKNPYYGKKIPIGTFC